MGKCNEPQKVVKMKNIIKKKRFLRLRIVPVSRHFCLSGSTIFRRHLPPILDFPPLPSTLSYLL